MNPVNTEIQQFDLLIDGHFVAPSTSKYFDSINPSNEEVFAKVADASLEDMKSAILAARKAFDCGNWPKLSVQERGKYLIQIAKAIRDHAKELAELESKDVGKTIKHTTFIDVPTCAETFDYFGKVSKELESKNNRAAAPVESISEREPIGVVGAIITWNYPLIMFAWKVAPALIAGNTVIFKPSSQASVSIMYLAKLIAGVGLPEGVLNIVSIKDHAVASELIKSELVDKISFTGGTETGQDVMRLASGNTKKLTLELGGKSPNIVFADCDFETALGGTLSAIFMNQGQMCTAGSRLLLEESIYEKFLNALGEKTKKLKIGNALDYQTEFGPLANKKQLETVLTYIEKGIQEGAKLLCGGNVPEGMNQGYYIEPTIFADVKNDMSIAQEEIFGPVLSVIKFSREDEAVKIANDTKFGLAACVWSKDQKKAKRVARQLRCGTVWINTYGGFYNEAPYGGYKQSGFGRELGMDGLFEYTQCKHICTDQTPGGKPLVAGWF
ncbi:MAG: aldehyde dehydrogenase family protein [Candidatus Omnitrophota bacterium]